MKSDRRAPVAIVGGGASGTILAAQLARRGIASLLVERGGQPGRGVAYSTPDPAHLLNVRAEGMSAWAGEPDDFARLFEAAGGSARDFAERRFYGGYLEGLLQVAEASGRTEVLGAAAVAAAAGEEWQVRLADGRSVAARALVLATGNQEPEPLRALAGIGNRVVANPWGATAQSAIQDAATNGGDVLSIGTGLTAVDLALSLDAAGFAGRMVAVSRRGLMPRSHAEFTPAAIERAALPAGNLRALARWLRRRTAEVGWRAAVDSLRPHSHWLWQSFDLAQQQRFLRHARPWWDVHRHRIAPQAAQTLVRMVSDGRLEVLAGRIVAAGAGDRGLDVDVQPRGSAGRRTIKAAYAFNCTGPLHAITRTRDPLLRSLLEGGHIKPDQLGIGIDVDARSRVAGADSLWALGGLTKGRYWEMVAIPDIREQAAWVAEDIATELAT